MRIGIDISQIAYEGTGVANYLSYLLDSIFSVDTENEYILFFSSFRRNIKSLPFGEGSLIQNIDSRYKNVKIKRFRFTPFLLNLLWNKLHIIPIEYFIGDVDWFITSDWTEPPVKKAKKATIIYDLVVYKNPNESDNKIVQTQKSKLFWVKKESNIIFCISESTKNDIEEVLKIRNEKIKVIYPGI